MKQRLGVFIALEVLACVALLAFGRAGGASIAMMAAFPFAQIGDGLRALSLSGSTGNVVAVAIYCILCLLPMLWMLIRAFRKRVCGEDALLPLLSGVLFAVMYWMVNPAYFAMHLGVGGTGGTNRAFAGVAVYSIIAGYAILRVLRSFTQSEGGRLIRSLKWLMAALCAIFVYAIFGSGLDGLLGAGMELKRANSALGGAELLPSYIFLAVQYLINALPYALSVAIIFAAIGLLARLEENPYDEEIAVSARGISWLCRRAVIAIMISQIAANVLQLALGALLHSSRYTLSIPLLTVIFVLAALLMAGYFEQARLIKDDNDSII